MVQRLYHHVVAHISARRMLMVVMQARRRGAARASHWGMDAQAAGRGVASMVGCAHPCATATRCLEARSTLVAVAIYRRRMVRLAGGCTEDRRACRPDRTHHRWVR